MQPIPGSASSPDAGLTPRMDRRSLLGGMGAVAMGAMFPPIPQAKKAPRPQAPDRTWPGDLDELLDDLVRKFEAAETSSAPARRLAERDRRYFDGYQWTPEQIRVLAERGQPAIVDNFIKEKVNYMLGAERRLRSDPKAYPRTPAQEDRADAATQMLRYVTDDNVFNRVRSDVFANIAVEGVGGCEVVAEDAGDGTMSVRIHHIPYNRLWWDPYSAHPDFQDARHLGTVIWGDREQFLALFPAAKSILDVTLGFQGDGIGTAFEDKPATPWVDSGRTRCRIVTCHWQHGGDWWTAIYTRGGFLHGPVVSPYVDRRGKTCAPLIMRSANVDGENNRYGLIRDLIPLQDEVNARRSKLMHLLNTRRIIMTQGAIDPGEHGDGIDQVREEAAKPDGVIVVTPGEMHKFSIDTNSEMSSGQFELLQHTIGRLQGHGPNASMTGKDPRELSGRAISLQQAGGAVEQEPDFDGLRMWSRRVYEAGWMRVRQFVDQEVWLRTTDAQDVQRFIGLNHPVTFGEALSRLPDPMRAVQMQRYGIQPNDPRLGIVVKYENDIGDLDMEITLEEGQDTPTMAAEQFQALMQFAQANPGAIPVEVLLQASSLKDKAKLIEGIKEHQQQQAQAAAAQHQVQQAMAQAQLQKVQADAADKAAQARDRSAQSVERMHGMAMDHAATQGVPVVPGVGPVQPEVNPLMQPPPMMPQGPQPGP